MEPYQHPHIGELALVEDEGGFEMAVGVGMLFGVGQFQPRRFNTQPAPGAFARNVLKRDDIIRKILQTLVTASASHKSSDEGSCNNEDNRYCQCIRYQHLLFPESHSPGYPRQQPRCGKPHPAGFLTCDYRIRQIHLAVKSKANSRNCRHIPAPPPLTASRYCPHGQIRFTGKKTFVICAQQQ